MATSFWRREREGQQLKEALLMQNQRQRGYNQNDPSSPTHNPITSQPVKIFKFSHWNISISDEESRQFNNIIPIIPCGFLSFPLLCLSFFFFISSPIFYLSFPLSLSPFFLHHVGIWKWFSSCSSRLRQWRSPIRQTRSQNWRFRA